MVGGTPGIPVVRGPVVRGEVPSAIGGAIVGPVGFGVFVGAVGVGAVVVIVGAGGVATESIRTFVPGCSSLIGSEPSSMCPVRGAVWVVRSSLALMYPGASRDRPPSRARPPSREAPGSSKLPIPPDGGGTAALYDFGGLGSSWELRMFLETA
ncbi:hypothetical protein DBP18_15175 [Streptomyces sp. CS081A]|nr:hypothetical protein DBP18_15175 [Streptomyces sp. CS081A]